MPSTPNQILQDAKRALAAHPADMKSAAVVSFFLPGNSRGERRKLVQLPGAPMGKIAAQYTDSDMVIFDAAAVVKFIEAALAQPTA